MLCLYIFELYARYLCSRAHSAKRARDDRVSCIQIFGMMINYSTLNYHVTITLTLSLGGSYGQIKTITLYSDPNPDTSSNQNLICKIPLLARALGLKAKRARR